MKLPRKGSDSEIPTSSMADIAFLLIIFFMVTAVFSATKGLEFKLPKDDNNAPPDTQEAVFVKVNADSSVLVDCKPMAPNEILDYLEPKLLRNDSESPNHWLKVVPLLADGETVAIGARVTVTAGSRQSIQPVHAVSGYLSASDPRPQFGLGTAERADRVEIRWPDGQVQELSDVATNQILEVVQGAQ